MISGGGSDLRGCGGGTSRNLGLVWAFLRILGPGLGVRAGRAASGRSGRGPLTSDGQWVVADGLWGGSRVSAVKGRQSGLWWPAFGGGLPMANGQWHSGPARRERWPVAGCACVRACVCARACTPPMCACVCTTQRQRHCQRPVGRAANGQWPTSAGPNPMGNSQWPMAMDPNRSGRWPMANGQGPQPHWPTSPMANGQWAMACALWLVIQWGVGCNGACGCSRCLQAARGGSWPMANGHGRQPQWPMANGQWQMSNGHRSWALARGHF